MINSPEENLQIPKNLRDKVNKIKMQLAIEEQEVKVFKNAKASMAKEVNQMVKDREALKNEIEALKMIKRNVEKDLDEAKRQEVIALDNLDDSKRKIKENEEQIREDYQIYEKENDKLVKDRIELKEDKAEFEKEKSAFEKEKSEYLNKINKLKEVIDV